MAHSSFSPPFLHKNQSDDDEDAMVRFNNHQCSIIPQTLDLTREPFNIHLNIVPKLLMLAASGCEPPNRNTQIPTNTRVKMYLNFTRYVMRVRGG